MKTFPCYHAIGNLYFVVLPDYFMNLGLSDKEASDLQWKYYQQYGLPLRGLVLHHEVGVSVRVPF